MRVSEVGNTCSAEKLEGFQALARLEPVWENLSRSADKIVRGVKRTVGASGADFHFRAAELVKKPRATPGIAKFRLIILAGTDGNGEFQLFQVVTEEGSGDFGVGAHGISSERAGVIAKCEIQVVDGVEGHFLVLKSDGRRDQRHRGLRDRRGWHG